MTSASQTSLLTQLAGYTEQICELESEVDRKRRDRDKTVRRAENSGLPRRLIAEACHLSRQRVHAILQEAAP